MVCFVADIFIGCLKVLPKPQNEQGSLSEDVMFGMQFCRERRNYDKKEGKESSSIQREKV
jgi:hypothetical protein